MKKLVILTIIILTLTNAFPQSGKILISLPDSIEPIKNLSFSVSDIIDARSTKDHLGLISRGGGTNNCRVLLEDNSPNLFDIVNSLILKNESKPKLVIIIRNILITDHIETITQVGHCNIELEFARKVDTSLYSLGSFFANTTESGNTVKYSHGERFIQTLRKCIEKFNSSNWNSKKGNILNSINKPIPLDYTKIPKKGIYLNYDQVTREAPMTNLDFQVIQNQRVKKYNSFKLDIDDVILTSNIQFISDGKNLYMRGNKDEFLIAESFGKYIFFRGKIPITFNEQVKNQSAKNAIALGVGIGFGAVGLTVFYSVGSPAYTDNGYKGVVIDTETAEIKYVTNKFLYRITKPYPLMLKEYRKSKRKPEDQAKVIRALNKEIE